jgi:DNA-binding MarR family transcriptional regulator/GNAT superfamily N-acetyltransferase
MTAAVSSPQNDYEIEAFRRFNRFYTRILGLLNEEMHQSGFSLTEARVLFELAQRADGGATRIAGELSLDPGYLSRILRQFKSQGLLARTPSPDDARNSLLRLTRKGVTTLADLNRRSSEQARQLLDKLSPANRSALTASMRTIERALAPAEDGQHPFVLRSHRPGDMGWVVARHGILYAREFGWDQNFEATVAAIVSGFITGFDARREHCWIAEREGEPLGSIFLVRDPEREDTAKLRLLLVEPSARGLGLGRALVGECLNFARAAGYRRVTLWTDSILTAAHHIYQRAGFRLTAEKPHHSFGKDLIGQTWEIDL